MDREIKFRGKSIFTGEWVYGYLCLQSYGKGYDLSIQHRDSYGTPTPVPVDASTVGQYTGRKDVDGVEMYEGDKVKTVDGDDNVRVIEYSEESACYIARHLPDSHYCDPYYLDDCPLKVVNDERFS